jgi:hypothetical protein
MPTKGQLRRLRDRRPIFIIEPLHGPRRIIRPTREWSFDGLSNCIDLDVGGGLRLVQHRPASYVLRTRDEEIVVLSAELAHGETRTGRRVIRVREVEDPPEPAALVRRGTLFDTPVHS